MSALWIIIISVVFVVAIIVTIVVARKSEQTSSRSGSKPGETGPNSGGPVASNISCDNAGTFLIRSKGQCPTFNSDGVLSFGDCTRKCLTVNPDGLSLSLSDCTGKPNQVFTSSFGVVRNIAYPQRCLDAGYIDQSGNIVPANENRWSHLSNICDNNMNQRMAYFPQLKAIEMGSNNGCLDSGGLKPWFNNCTGSPEKPNPNQQWDILHFNTQTQTYEGL
jgi:hypothetical protein